MVVKFFGSTTTIRIAGCIQTHKANAPESVTGIVACVGGLDGQTPGWECHAPQFDPDP